MLTHALLYTLATIVLSASASDVGYYNSTSCIDPSGFTSCYGSANSTYADCLKRKCRENDVDCIDACECARSTTYIDCAASSCWNQVYSCEYQLTVSDYINYCVEPNLDTIPYWPPPDDAPIGCSCPIGQLQQSILSDVTHLNACTNNQTNLDEQLNKDDLANYREACTCCYLSGILSAIYDVCPSTSPHLLGADTYFSTLFTDTDWSLCAVYLAAYNCTTELGFSSPAPNITHFYAPDDFPTNGTLGLFDTKVGEMTTPVSGSVFTWTAGGVARTVSAADVTAGVRGAVRTSAVTGTGTSSAAGAERTSGGVRTGVGVGVWGVVLGIVVGVLVL